LAVVLSVVRADPSSAWRGAVLLGLGVPVFYWFTRAPAARARRAAAERERAGVGPREQ